MRITTDNGKTFSPILKLAANGTISITGGPLPLSFVLSIRDGDFWDQAVVCAAERSDWFARRRVAGC